MQEIERVKIIGVDISVVNFDSAQKYLFDNFDLARESTSVLRMYIQRLQPMKIQITEEFKILLL